ncbi:MAG: phosphatase PAP2 family protein [Rhodobacteraceae bacterium]|nr:phosphatase PAP2 family protein [Paracoccaceae bacterium]
MPDSFPTDAQVRALALAILAAAALFTAFPAIDLVVSSWFYRPGAGFWRDGLALPTAIRLTAWRLTEAMILAGVAGLLWAAAGRRIAGIAPRVWGFVLALYALGPGLLVNLVLKNNWGRARPADITDFGGAHDFTPPLVLADACARNCSFVSGEVSANAAFAISLAVLVRAVRPRLAPATAATVTWAGVVVALVGSAQRITTGRHFLSDAVFAVLFVLAIAVLLAPLARGAGAGDMPADPPC